METSTQDRIINYIRKKNTATVNELSRYFGLTKPNIQYHLKNLIEMGTVVNTTDPATKQQRRGRPVITYRLNKKVLSNNYALFSRILLGDFFAKVNSDNQMQKKLTILGTHLIDKKCREKSMANCLNNLMDFLKPLSYDPHWEAHHKGPQILYKNCPYAEILNQFPQLCRMDEIILSSYLNTKVKLLRRIDYDNEQFPACVFALEE